MNPKDALATLTKYHAELSAAARLSVAVGLPKEKVTAKVYGDGSTVVEVGAVHEFGSGRVPSRSFLRVPFEQKKGALEAFIRSEFQAVLEQERTASKALDKVGAAATNISKGAFLDNEWPALKPATIAAKGSSRPLIDTGTLRASLTWAVRG